ncbi:DUF559 domain-containing protein [Antrihabitans cavernicola]|uniref:DUF559 domain-containing protein n=1 Tax=Antrihabitans cavernicola TaxID=2495913 RepID=A0A5A7S2Q4_9NOCA|nr:DUF559 domain-containing protein [Spelaeibacter cavernicola]
MLPAIYSIGEPTGLGRCFAVTQWQPHAVLSHRTAAWLHGWLPEPSLIEATIPRSCRVRTSVRWVHLYRRDLDSLEIAESWSMPTTSHDQTLFDCIAVCRSDELAKLVDDQLTRSVSREALQLLRKKKVKQWGTVEVDRQLRIAAVHSASEPERMLARALNSRCFPLLANLPVGRYIGDFVDERGRVVVEVDGREFHSDPTTFRNDRRRQNWLVSEGWLVLRYAAYHVLADPDAVADEVIRVVRRRRHLRRLPFDATRNCPSATMSAGGGHVEICGTRSAAGAGRSGDRRPAPRSRRRGRSAGQRADSRPRRIGAVHCCSCPRRDRPRIRADRFTRHSCRNPRRRCGYLCDRRTAAIRRS